MKHMAFVMALVAIAGCSKGERKPAAGDTTSMMMSSDSSQMSMSDTSHGMRSDSAHMMAPDTSKMKMSRGTASADPAMVARGQDIYKKKGCAACHNIAKAGEEPHRRPGGKQAGPDLARVTERRDHDWLRRWLKDPPGMLETDPTAKAMMAQAQNLKMPDPKLTDEEIEAVIAYLSVPQQ
jgi:cbb3-type cytochrome oxidase cytochrome c subunit